MLKLAVLRSLLLSLLRSLLRLDALRLIVASLIARTVLPPISHKHFLSILSSFHDKSLPLNESAEELKNSAFMLLCSFSNSCNCMCQ